MSNFLGLNIKDLIKGIITAVLTALIAFAYKAIEAGTIEFTWVFWKPAVLSAVGAGLAYMLKSWLTNSDGKFGSKEP